MTTRTTKKQTKLWLVAGMLSAIGACQGPAPTAPPTEAELAPKAQEMVNQYAAALMGSDEAALQRLLSSEVLGKIAEYPGGMKRFIEKQRSALFKTFSSMEKAGMGSGFAITKVAAQEGDVEVSLRFQGQEVPRPFHLVMEGGAYKLNVARPGFSKKLGNGALASDSYRVVSSYDAVGSSITCANGFKWTTLNKGTDANPDHSGFWASTYVTCDNRCGFWSGTYLSGPGWVSENHYCDYNTWGADVINSSQGMVCNDPC